MVGSDDLVSFHQPSGLISVETVDGGITTINAAEIGTRYGVNESGRVFERSGMDSRWRTWDV